MNSDIFGQLSMSNLMMWGKKLLMYSLFFTLYVQQNVGESKFEADEETEDDGVFVVTKIPTETK